MIKTIHSYWAIIALVVLIAAVINALHGIISKKEFLEKDLRISLFAVIATHIQLILGFVAYYFSSFYETMRAIGMGQVMKNSELRKLLVEHPVTVIIAITLITMGFSKHKNKQSSTAKFKTIAIYYSIALLLILLVIPWKLWFTAN